jgi:hypothetical protein
MLFRRQPAVVEEPVTQVVVPDPFPEFVVPSRLLDLVTQEAYEKLAGGLGFNPTELIRVRLINFMADAGIGIYDYRQVSEWLRKRRLQEGKARWCWRPLRAIDTITEYSWGRNETTFHWQDGFYSSGDDDCRVYDRLVPFSALEKVATIQRKFGSEVKFFVSDYATRATTRPVDPFIMVRPSARSANTEDYNLIFDHWDEPGFGESE